MSSGGLAMQILLYSVIENACGLSIRLHNWTRKYHSETGHTGRVHPSCYDVATKRSSRYEISRIKVSCKRRSTTRFNTKSVSQCIGTVKACIVFVDLRWRQHDMLGIERKRKYNATRNHVDESNLKKTKMELSNISRFKREIKPRQSSVSLKWNWKYYGMLTLKHNVTNFNRNIWREKALYIAT